MGKYFAQNNIITSHCSSPHCPMPTEHISSINMPRISALSTHQSMQQYVRDWEAGIAQTTCYRNFQNPPPPEVITIKNGDKIDLSKYDNH